MKFLIQDLNTIICDKIILFLLLGKKKLIIEATLFSSFRQKLDLSLLVSMK